MKRETEMINKIFLRFSSKARVKEGSGRGGELSVCLSVPQHICLCERLSVALSYWHEIRWHETPFLHLQSSLPLCFARKKRGEKFPFFPMRSVVASELFPVMRLANFFASVNVLLNYLYNYLLDYLFKYSFDCLSNYYYNYYFIMQSHWEICTSNYGLHINDPTLDY